MNAHAYLASVEPMTIGRYRQMEADASFLWTSCAEWERPPMYQFDAITAARDEFFSLWGGCVTATKIDDTMARIWGRPRLVRGYDPITDTLYMQPGTKDRLHHRTHDIVVKPLHQWEDHYYISFVEFEAERLINIADIPAEKVLSTRVGHADN